MLSVNHVVQADIDAVAKEGSVEVLASGLFNQETSDVQRKSYITKIRATPGGSEITTSGPTRKGAYVVHLVNMQWVSGIPDCAYQRR